MKSLNHYWSVTIALLLVSIILMAGVMRLSSVKNLPTGFFVDETSIMYNAWSIEETGKDEHGNAWPVFFKAFGEYKKPVYIYSMALGFKVWPELMESPRIISALWGILGIIVFGWVSCVISNQKKVALFGMALLGTMPAHLILSRVIFEIISYPVFYFASVGFLWLYYREKKSKYLYLFIVFQGLTLYSYTSSLVVAPLVTAVALCVFRSRLTITQWIASTLLCLITALPLIWWEYLYPGSALSRFYTVTAISTEWSVGILLSRALEHVTPTFLFMMADENLRHSLIGHGVLPWVSLPLILVGVWAMIKEGENRFSRWVLISSLVGLLPVIVSPQTPHVLRSIGWWLNLTLICVIGFTSLIKKKQLAVLVISLCLLLESWWIGRDLFVRYPSASQVWFETDTVNALNIATTAKAPYYLSEKLYPGTPISWAWVKQIPPVEYQQRNTKTTTITTTDNFIFTPGTYILSHDECQELPEWFTQRARKLSTNQDFTCVYEY